ncbi:hypothetical protein ACHAQH_004498, partial [Verticillium albo-atrum]
MLASGHFGNNQAGQLKVLVVLTSTDVVDKQEPVTPLRPDEYSTPVKEEKKRKVKREDASPASGHKKRIKREKQMKQEKGNVETDEVRQEIHVKMEQEEPLSSPSCQSPTDDELGDAVEETVEHEDVIDLCEVENPLHELAEGYRGMSDKGDKVDEEDSEEVLATEF